MNLSAIWKRAQRGVKEDSRLNLVAVLSLTVAFLCLSSCLLAMANLSSMADRWSRTGRMTVYLRDGKSGLEVEQLRTLLEALPELHHVRLVSAQEALRQFARQADLAPGLSSLPADAFPSSIEADLAPGVDDARLREITKRLQKFSAVQDVETYRSWFQKLEALLRVLRVTSTAVGALVAFCVLAVVGSTIRLALAARRDEIEVLKLCGATDSFVRSPFLMEGALQGFVASLLAIGLLFIAFLVLRTEFDATLGSFTGVRAAFLHPLTVLGLLVTGSAVGALGSAISMRGYLTV